MTKYSNNSIIYDLYVKEDLDKLLNNEFIFSRKYDMEQCLSPVKMEQINWNSIPYEDEEWTWVFHRMEYCVDLCYETEKTKDITYIEHAKVLIFDFIHNAASNPNLRTLDTAIRIISWIKFIKIATKFRILTPNELLTLEKTIVTHIHTLYNNYRVTDSVSNWGAIQCIAVLIAEEHYELNPEIISFFEDEFTNHLDQQYYLDGMQWEQSSVYIVEVTVKMLQMTNKKFQSPLYFKVLEQVFNALYCISDNDYNTILIGDGDKINIEGLLQSIAYVTQNAGLLKKLKNSKIYEEVYHLFGADAIHYFQNNKNLINLQEDNIQLLENSGLLSYKNKNLFLTFQNGPMGGGHGHSDNLHINLSINGQDLLIDSGRYSYVNTYEQRQYFKDSTAHNGFIFDNEMVKYSDSWRSFSNFHYSPIHYKQESDFLYASASVTNNSKFGCRELICFNNGDLLIINSSFSEFKVNYILDDSINTKRCNSHTLINNQKFYNLGSKYESQKCNISKHYNTKTESTLLHCSSSKGQQISFICAENSNISESFDYKYVYPIEENSIDDSMRMFNIYSNKKQYIVFYLPFENSINNSSIIYKNKILTGKLILYNETDDTTFILKN